MKSSKVCVIVPAFNEQESITEVIKDLRNSGFKKIIAIDDGSSDDTSRLLAKNKVVFAQHLINRGLGASLGTGFAFARRAGAEIAVTFDSDGQHKAKDISKLIRPILQGEADVVIGSRFKDFQNIPFPRQVANYLSNIITFLFYGVWTSDSQSGLRAFNRKAIEKIKIKTDRMEVSSEFFKEIRMNKLRLKEVDIKALYTDYSLKNSKQGAILFSSIRIGLRLLMRLFR